MSVKQTMQPELFNEWVADLKSGEFEQAKNALEATGRTKEYAYCCLGVLSTRLAERGIATFENGFISLKDGERDKWDNPSGSDTELTDEVLNAIGMDSTQQEALIGFNDGAELNFEQIAYMLEHEIV